MKKIFTNLVSGMNQPPDKTEKASQLAVPTVQDIDTLKDQIDTIDLAITRHSRLSGVEYVNIEETKEKVGGQHTQIRPGHYINRMEQNVQSESKGYRLFGGMTQRIKASNFATYKQERA